MDQNHIIVDDDLLKLCSKYNNFQKIIDAKDSLITQLNVEKQFLIDELNMIKNKPQIDNELKLLQISIDECKNVLKTYKTDTMCRKELADSCEKICRLENELGTLKREHGKKIDELNDDKRKLQEKVNTLEFNKELTDSENNIKLEVHKLDYEKLESESKKKFSEMVCHYEKTQQKLHEEINQFKIEQIQLYEKINYLDNQQRISNLKSTGKNISFQSKPRTSSIAFVEKKIDLTDEEIQPKKQRKLYNPREEY